MKHFSVENRYYEETAMYNIMHCAFSIPDFSTGQE